jgi:hypothetical protein
MSKSKLIAATLLLTAVATANASSCELYGIMANAVMHGRQLGLSISEALEPKNGVKVSEVVEELVFAAYEQPRYRTQEYQLRAREEFQNAIELACYRQLKGRRK